MIKKGIASVASALSQYIDYLFNRAIRKYLLLHVPMSIHGLGQYPDFLAFLLVCIGIGLMIIGIRESGLINKLFAVFNIALLLFIIIIGATRADISNWNLRPNVIFFLNFKLCRSILKILIFLN